MDGMIGICQQILIKDNLDKHLLTGLSTIGVPKELKNTVFPFEYGNYLSFKK